MARKARATVGHRPPPRPRAPCRASGAVLPAVDRCRPACRAGQRLSSMLSAAISCFSSRIWSSVSRMVKFDLQPDQFGMAAQQLDADRVEGAQPGHALDRSPSMRPTRFFISRAALLVKVTARISFGRAVPVFSRCAIRVVSALVLPVPAPASISTGPSSASTAARCAGSAHPDRAAAARPSHARQRHGGLTFGIVDHIHTFSIGAGNRYGKSMFPFRSAPSFICRSAPRPGSACSRACGVRPSAPQRWSGPTIPARMSGRWSAG